MAFLKVFFEKRPLLSEEKPQEFFENVEGEYRFLLESAKDGRYSYIGYDPFVIVKYSHGIVHLLKRRDFLHLKKNPQHEIIDQEPLKVLQDLLKNWYVKNEGPLPFSGGALGYFSYEFGSELMNIKKETVNDLMLPDFHVSFVDKIIGFDHRNREIFFIAVAENNSDGKEKIDHIKKTFRKKPSLQRKGEIGHLTSNLSKAEYEKKIKEVKKFLENGETYQVNFSQRFTATCTADPWNIYKNLTKLNPSPFACYFDYPDFQIASCSPELLFSKKGHHIETWPIKGTVKRGKNEKEDKDLIQQLLESEKDKAELTMIVDLERNDLGKVCEIGSVEVENHREIQTYSHVIHTVSKISGKLHYQKDIFDVLKAMFPGGSITGCPKKRTMEIINKLEDYHRGVYTGSAGYLNFSGDGMMNILIRTFLFKNNQCYAHAGGGIVIDSNPEEEYNESLQKAEALKKALNMAP